MTRAPILSDGELTALDWELRDKIDDRIPDNSWERSVKKEPSGFAVFPIDGYLSWQHRWLIGTGRRPPDW